MYTRVLTLLSTVFLLLSSVQVGLLGVILYHDLTLSKPIQEVEVFTATTTSPGEVVDLEFNYNKKSYAREVIIDRWIACENGTSWNVQELSSKRLDLPNHKKYVSFEVPRGVEPDQTCLYGSRIRIPRILLPDIEIRVPPVDVPIQVRPGVKRVQELGPHYHDR